MKKLLSLALATALTATALTGCSSGGSAASTQEVSGGDCPKTKMTLVH